MLEILSAIVKTKLSTGIFALVSREKQDAKSVI